MVLPPLARPTIWRQMREQHAAYATTCAYSCGIVAYACYRLDAFGEAQRWYHHLLRLDPHHTDATLMLVRIKTRMNNEPYSYEEIAAIAA